ncbi:MAG: glycine--tRNA ligase subunit beta [Actinomycetota bacterium]|nr:glycine--tRNA ligase subunit beta [Actinomycetota bacterium]
MGSKELLFEIGTEELPSESVYKGLEQLEEKAAKLFEENRLSFSSIETFATPRRLVLNVKGLSDKQSPQTSRIKGPSLKAAFDAEGKPTAAAMGFSASQGAEVSDLEVVEADGASYIYAVRTEAEVSAADLLPTLLFELIRSISFSKPMRWQIESNLTFARPIRWLLGMLGDQRIDLSFGELNSGGDTYGHRILSRGPIEIESARDYFAKIEKAKVILDPARRKEIIEEGILKVLQPSERANINPKTMSEVINLVEFPTVVCANFSDDYLAIPKKVLTTAMESHQRYFPVEDEDGNLKSKFILVHNGDPAANVTIKKGHERVISARLADAKFFYHEDTKKPLEESIEKLKGVVFQERLGTVYGKALRLQKLSEFLAKALEKDHLVEKAKRAALLSKADLVSEMVVEFPDLQGVMGKEYAMTSGEDIDVAEAIFEHYLPKSFDDELPKSPIGAILSMADKIDTIVGAFAVGLIPSGSQDPYALRRQTQGIVAIVLAMDLEISLGDFIEAAINLYEQENVRFTRQKSEAKREVEDFFAGRIKQHFILLGHAQDVIEAVLAPGLRGLSIIEDKIELLSKEKEGDLVADVFYVYNRCKNLSRSELGTSIEDSLLKQPEEMVLSARLKDVKAEVLKASLEKNFMAMLKLFAGLKGPVDSFFEAVLVMEKDDKIRENRIKILNLASELFEEFADFSKLTMAGD